MSNAENLRSCQYIAMCHSAIAREEKRSPEVRKQHAESAERNYKAARVLLGIENY